MTFMRRNHDKPFVQFAVAYWPRAVRNLSIDLGLRELERIVRTMRYQMARRGRARRPQ
jgi:hypothetical protein